MTTKTLYDFRHRLVNLRISKRLTQRELAEMLDISQSLLGDIEKGRRNVNDVLKVKYADFFNQNVEDIFFNPNDRK